MLRFLTAHLASLALHVPRLNPLFLVHLQEHRRGGDIGGSGAASGTAGALSSAAQRRSRRPSLLGAVAASSPFNLLHFRLSLVDRDFTEPGDYELLLRLDELEAGESDCITQ